MRGKTLLVSLWVVSAAWLAGLLYAPLTIAPGSVGGLDGRANVMDYGVRWADLPGFASVVYAIGDFTCHQMASRSWSLNGNQLPVDVRMTAAFFGAVIGLPLALLLPALPRVRDELSFVLPRPWRPWFGTPTRRLALLAVAWALVALPAALDVGAQLATAYESTNTRRAWTGLWLGTGASFLVGVLFDSLLAPGGPVLLASDRPREAADA